MQDVLATAKTASTRIHGSIEASLLGVEPKAGSALAAQVARLLQWRGDVVRNVQPGDHLAVLFDATSEPELLALRYEGAEIRLTAVRFDDAQGLFRFYDTDGRGILPQLRRAPVLSYQQITEVVQSGRGKRRHHGVDLKAPEGTPVVLPFAARIERVNWNRRINGNCVEVRYDDPGLDGHPYARFLHLYFVDEGITPGARLPPGAPLGAVGTTGHSGAPHLHYELSDAEGKILDPLRVHGTLTREIEPGVRDAFERQVGAYLKRLPPPVPRPPK